VRLREREERRREIKQRSERLSLIKKIKYGKEKGKKCWSMNNGKRKKDVWEN
jgi:hypothetical protein